MWPPVYTIKKHLRAKHVKLRVLQSGLQITVPYRFNLSQLPAVLDEHKGWILGRLAEQPLAEIALPTEINLLGVNECWKVHYIPAETVPRVMKHAEYELTLIGNLEDKLLCARYLSAWVKQYARRLLPQYLSQVSQEVGLSYASARVKDQKTVWGSCTASKMINLNYKLIFFPTTLMRHVLIHELAHTIHMNHSAAFWKLVYTLDLNGAHNRQLLKKGGNYLPAWIS